MTDPRIKQLKIKTGVLKRVGKEKLSYRKEADQQKLKIVKMKEDGKDEHEIKKNGRGVSGDTHDDSRLPSKVGGSPW